MQPRKGRCYRRRPELDPSCPAPIKAWLPSLNIAGLESEQRIFQGFAYLQQSAIVVGNGASEMSDSQEVVLDPYRDVT